MNYQIIIGFIVVALVAWIIGRLKPFGFVEDNLKRSGAQKLIQEWFVKHPICTFWTCISDVTEKGGGPFGLSARLITFENQHERICMSDTDPVFDQISIGTKVKFRMRAGGEGKLGRIGGMLDTYLLPVVLD